MPQKNTYGDSLKIAADLDADRANFARVTQTSMQRVEGRIPPVEPREAHEASVPADESALRAVSDGRQVGVINVISTKAEVPTPSSPLRANPSGPWGFSEEGRSPESRQENQWPLREEKGCGRYWDE